MGIKLSSKDDEKNFLMRIWTLLALTLVLYSSSRHLSDEI
jgi:hypothetical protein